MFCILHQLLSGSYGGRRVGCVWCWFCLCTRGTAHAALSQCLVCRCSGLWRKKVLCNLLCCRVLPNKSNASWHEFQSHGLAALSALCRLNPAGLRRLACSKRPESRRERLIEVGRFRHFPVLAAQANISAKLSSALCSGNTPRKISHVIDMASSPAYIKKPSSLTAPNTWGSHTIEILLCCHFTEATEIRHQTSLSLVFYLSLPIYTMWDQ